MSFSFPFRMGITALRGSITILLPTMSPTHDASTYTLTITEGDATAIDGAAGFSGEAPLTFTLTGSPPAGLTINASTGSINASALADGSFTWTVTATNDGGSATSGSYSLTVEAAAPTNLISGSPTGDADTTLSEPVAGAFRATLTGANNPRQEWELTGLTSGATYNVLIEMTARDDSASEAGSAFLRVTTGAELTGTTLVGTTIAGGTLTGTLNSTFVAPANGTVYVGSVWATSVSGAWFETNLPVVETT